MRGIGPAVLVVNVAIVGLLIWFGIHGPHQSTKQTLLMVPAMPSDQNCSLADIAMDGAVTLHWPCIDKTAAAYRQDAPSMFGAVAVTLKAAKETAAKP
ncbi:hypothetical protein H8A95_15940 [Bradyrhizobium sp. Pear76]|uniref:hypothetical protein n=1 Tax=Bradyrhizobium oropedii TaxID=1571201 RepID=UPI001E2DE83E|nr:hypothetical protein [Bradyrhizobium oropedii]MCC8963762.1 hypothetical protein [Bradyrhizobium oropedii]